MNADAGGRTLQKETPMVPIQARTERSPPWRAGLFLIAPRFPYALLARCARSNYSLSHIAYRIVARVDPVTRQPRQVFPVVRAIAANERRMLEGRREGGRRQGRGLNRARERQEVER
jgi:hypothetical protein